MLVLGTVHLTKDVQMLSHVKSSSEGNLLKRTKELIGSQVGRLKGLRFGLIMQSDNTCSNCVESVCLSYWSRGQGISCQGR